MSIEPNLTPEESVSIPSPENEEAVTTATEQAQPEAAPVEKAREEVIIIEETKPAKPEGLSAQDEALALMGEMKVYKIGDLVEGTIVQVTDDQLIVDIGTKTEGIVNRDEITLGPNPDMKSFSVGDKISVTVISEDEEGTYTLSKRRADQHLVWDKVEDSLQNGTRIDATGFRAIKGGLLVDIGAIAFLPQSLIDIKRIDDLESLVGQKFEVKVVDYDREAKPHPKIVISRRAVLEEDLTQERDQLYDGFEVNSVIDGKVVKLTNYGAFVDIGGLQGLLHISEMSLGRIDHPSEVMKEGDTIKVKVLKIEKNKKRISLGRRDLLPNPWEAVKDKFRMGTVVEGTVVRVAEFGAFIRLDDYFEGLAHISELVDNKISHAKEVFKPGDKVNVIILNIDKKHKRIKLSVKRAADAQRKAEVNAFMKAQGDLGDMFGIQLKEALKEAAIEIGSVSQEDETPIEEPKAEIPVKETVAVEAEVPVEVEESVEEIPSELEPVSEPVEIEAAEVEVPAEEPVVAEGTPDEKPAGEMNGTPI